MYYYEILNRETLEKAQGQAKSMRAMCESLGWRPQDCKCIYRARLYSRGTCFASECEHMFIYASYAPAL